MLHCQRTGNPDGPPVLFLHGFMGDAAEWDDVAGAFSADFDCLAVDLPGHGRSVGRAAEDYTMEGASLALLEVLGAAGVERCAVVGYSMGGRLALYFALRHAGRCRRLVLESASPGLRTEEARAARRRLDAERAEGIVADFEAFLGAWYRQPLFETIAEDEALRRRMVEQRRRNDPAELARVLRGMGTGSQPSLWERLEALQVNTLALAGARDGKYVEIAGRMARCTPRIRAATVPDAGHNVHAEQPHTFVDLLREAITKP